MRTFKPGIILFALLVAFSTCQQPGPNKDEMIAAAKSVDEQFLTAFNSGDVDGVMATYWNSPNVVSFPPDMTEARGWESIRVGFEETFANMMGGKLEPIETNYDVYGDAVCSWGTMKVTMPAMETGMEHPAVRYTAIIAKRDGKWVYVMDHASLVMPSHEMNMDPEMETDMEDMEDMDMSNK